MAKPLLIIGCSDNKAQTESQAFDLYLGHVYELIRANIDNVHDHFEVLILSGLHGLIHSKQVIGHYDQQMPKRTQTTAMEAYVDKHTAGTNKLLKQYAEKSRDLFVVLSNDYLKVFDLMTKKPSSQKLLNTFNSTYFCRKHIGVGVLRGRLKKILNNVPKPFSPVLYRSGLASADEFTGYSAANACLGASLAYVSDIKQPHLLDMMKQSLIRGNRAFLDNGVITEVGKGNFVQPQEVFSRYKRIVESFKGDAKKLSIVIPDNPFDPAASLAIVKENKSVIKWLARRCDVILPIHKAPDIGQHAMSMMKALSFAPIRVGIPCKKYISTIEVVDGQEVKVNVPVRLSPLEIEQLFELKAPNKERLFTGAHFLACSEVTRGGVYEERKTLAHIHGFDASFDACRTAAVLGNEKSSSRIGSQLLREVNVEITKDKTLRSPEYARHDCTEEYEDPLAFTSAAEAIEENVFAFVELWNESMEAVWELDVSGMQEEDAKEYCLNLLCSFPRDIEDQLLKGLKLAYWQSFTCRHHQATNFEKRTETFTRLFSDGQRVAVQTTLPI
ncbi:hypothetical protein NMR92_001377 [Vibrio cholerae]|uniref:Uncharacterized protein n=1 Tax=Vibrio parahaemolyticus TaxID=670 RepID=A0A1B1LRC7_VIBPH|nr:DUF6884 domain-containing protein [Vibrio parahaemolyticus]EJL6490477.1 hypothetical protein [Vibrio cholerae]ANS55606.1 hypothetical protein [Vibrio parahaemolyticus]EJL6642168.1 hypothetical protein [Vibrio cholerae]MCI9701182.1 hypothetical protein [Vibrio parahaemolyticus]MCR9814164.1 hypothetical protein [Vibrio parahaemolyticus]